MFRVITYCWFVSGWLRRCDCLGFNPSSMGGGDGGDSPESGRNQLSLYTKRIIFASLSASVSETATFPIDIIKTRLQSHTFSSSSSRTANSFNVALGIWRSEGGFFGLYKGLPPAILRHLFYTPIRIVGYEHLRNITGGGNGGFRYFSADSLFGRSICGGFSGVVAQIVASPADLIKVRMQVDGQLVRRGIEARYTGIADAFAKIIKTDGVRGLWKGALPNAQRAFLVNMGELACYDQAKGFIVNSKIAQDGIYAHTLASIASGLSATILSCPADVVKTRMMSQASCMETKVMYRSSYDCLVKTVRMEGIMTLWKGFFPTWARLGPWQFVFWVSYENLDTLQVFLLSS